MIEHVPPHIFGALYRYYKHNCQPGSCTSAIIKAVDDSDIYDAATRADQLTKAHFADIIMFVGKHASQLRSKQASGSHCRPASQHAQPASQPASASQPAGRQAAVAELTS